MMACDAKEERFEEGKHSLGQDRADCFHRKFYDGVEVLVCNDS